MEFVTNTKVLIAVVALLVVVILVWLFLPMMMRSPTIPKPETEAFGNAKAEETKSEDKNMPFVDPKTGSLIDGPGFEKGEVEGVAQDARESIPSNMYFLSDGSNGDMSIQHNLCSKSCCSEQWPTNIKMKHDEYVCGNKDKFVSSKLFCNNSFNDSGCLCLTKKQAQFLYNRGGNGNDLF